MDFDKFLKPLMSTVPLTFTPIGSIVAMFVIVYLSKIQHVMYSIVLTRKYDLVNASYRNDNQKSTWNTEIIKRAYNAHQNNWEAFISYSIAMILILQQNISSNEINQLCNLFIIVRITYSLIYPLAFAVPLAMIRSGVFTIGIITIMKLFFIAAPSLYNSPNIEIVKKTIQKIVLEEQL